MKMKLLMSVAIIAIACSCEKEKMLPEPDKETTFQVQKLETRSMNAMLSFASEEEMFEQIQELKLMSEEEMATWYNNQCPDFLSQFDFMWQIIEELENATSMDEVREIQAKYQDKMLFNTDPEDNDISPYIPSSYRGTEFVCNANGNVLIGGEVRNYNNLTACEQTPDYPFCHKQPQTRTARAKISGVQVTTSDRKFWAEAYLNAQTGGVEIKLVAHKKGTFGWNKYKTAYSLKILEYYNWVEVGALAVNVLNARPNYYTTGDIKSGQYFPFVRGRKPGTSKAVFLLEAYSRGVKEVNAKKFGVICIPVPTRTEDDYYIVDDDNNYGILRQDE